MRRIVREREARVEALDGRAEALEREQELRIREAAELERSTIARELHDVVAHKVSVMVVQAGAERSVLDPAATLDRGDTPHDRGDGKRGARRAPTAARRPPQRRGSALAPQPTLADVDALVAQVRDAGVDVELQIEGERRRLHRGSSCPRSGSSRRR